MEVNHHRFKSGKSYAYIKTPSGQKVFLRNILFLHNADPEASHQIALVHEFGKRTQKAAWEPPKGQMEWKEFSSEGVSAGARITARSLERHQREGVLRELTEEAKILPSEITGLKRLPYAYKQPWPESGVENAFFIYQYWQDKTTPTILLEAQKRLDILKADNDLKAMLPPDNSEKDGVRWWSPRSSDGWEIIYGDFSKKMTQCYFKALPKLHDV